MVHRLDHIVIAIRDLARASAYYQRVGFTVTPGGEHASGDTHNALICPNGARIRIVRASR